MATYRYTKKNPGTQWRALAVGSITRWVCVVTCHAFLCGCIVTHTDLRTEGGGTENTSTVEVPLFYHMDPMALLEKNLTAPQYHRVPRPIFDFSRPTGESFRALERALSSNDTFTVTEARDSAPARGLFCSVDIRGKPHSIGAWFAQAFTAGTLGLIPSYSGESGFSVKYNLYVDGDPRKTYRYDVRTQVYAWLVFLPFVWVNLATPSQGEALASTASAFFHDLERDGYLQPYTAAGDGTGD